MCYDSAIMLTKTKKSKAIKEAQKNENDTGSAHVQISILTKEIEELAKHLKKNHKDKHSRRGLLQKVANRQKHMRYLQKTDEKGYTVLAKKLGLKAKKA